MRTSLFDGRIYDNVVVYAQDASITNALRTKLERLKHTVAPTHPFPKLTEPDALRDHFRLLNQVGTKIDAVICCVGSTASKLFPALDFKNFQDSVESQVYGQIRLAIAALAEMRSGTITLTSVPKSRSPDSIGEAFAYGALEAFVKATAAERTDININFLRVPLRAPSPTAPLPTFPIAKLVDAYVDALRKPPESGTGRDAK